MKRTAVAITVFMTCVVVGALLPTAVGADVLNGHGPDSTGWYPDEAQLTSTVVPGGTFGQLFSSKVSGQVYAQPVLRNGTVLVGTERNNIYGFDSRTGAQLWTRNLGVPWNTADIFNCADLAPTVGITGTPVIDPATNTEYLFKKTYVSGTSGPAQYWMHAIDVATGAERANFPVLISGVADNAPSVAFDATPELQRPGLLLMNGVVYAAFGGLCDRDNFRGWIIGVSTGGQITARWAAQTSVFPGSGIWQSGGPLISDMPGDIVAVTGNGHLQLGGPTPGTTPPGDLSEAAIRVRVQPDGTLKTVDFFTPYDAPELDAHDVDFGSGGPVALPDGFGTPSHPHLIIAIGKAGYLYLLDRDHLGGYRNNGELSDDVVARLGPNGGVWSTPAVWPGDGGYVYITHAGGPAGGHAGHLRAYKHGVDANGNPTLAFVGQSDDIFGFGSGTPVVTSDGTNPGSALVWVIWQADGTGANAQLRAYDAVPVNGHLHLRWSAPIGTATKFEAPAVDAGAVYVGTRDGGDGNGRIIGFGSPVDQPLAASPGELSFDATTMGQSSTKTFTFNATRALTLSSLTSSAPAVFSVTSTSRALPTTIDPVTPLTVNVTFAPNVKGLLSGTLTADVTSGTDPNVGVGLTGIGRTATGDLDVFPANLTLGGAPIGGAPLTSTVTFSNLGAQDMKVVGLVLPDPASHFTTSGVPPIGSTLPAGESRTATVTFTPSADGVFTSFLRMATDAQPPGTHDLTVSLTASAAAPAHLVVPGTTYFGPVRVGSTKTDSILFKNVGKTALSITKSKPPANGVGFNAVFPVLDEGSGIAANQGWLQQVSFHPTITGHFADIWIVNADDDSGLHTLTFDGWGVPPTSAYWMLDKNGNVYGFGNAGPFTTVPTGFAAVSIVPYWSGKGFYVLDELGNVRTAGDARWYGSMSLTWFRPFERAASMSLTPSGKGYWIFTSMGRVFAFGDARRFGDLSNKRLNGPVISSVATPTGQGYYMVGSDGGVFAFGDAKYLGSTGGMHLNKPVVGILPTATGMGYWLAASDGGVFTFGDARFRGSMGGHTLNQPVCGMVRYGDGYLMVASDGGIFNFSSSRFVGSLGGRTLPAPIVGVGAFAA
jgi:iron transport multicopper oxidase